MWRIVRGAVLAAAVALAAGCGRATGPDAPPVREDSTPGLASALLVPRDMPDGYLPAEAQPAFHGVVARGPHCRRLLALADGRSLRDAPGTGTSFYQRAPGATLTQHLFATGVARAKRILAETRKEASKCRLLRARVGGTELILPQVPLEVPGLPARDTVAVRFAEPEDERRELGYEFVMHRVGGVLLVVAQPGIVRAGAPSVTADAAGRAAERLGGTHKLGP